MTIFSVALMLLMKTMMMYQPLLKQKPAKSRHQQKKPRLQVVIRQEMALPKLKAVLHQMVMTKEEEAEEEAIAQEVVGKTARTEAVAEEEVVEVEEEEEESKTTKDSIWLLKDKKEVAEVEVTEAAEQEAEVTEEEVQIDLRLQEVMEPEVTEEEAVKEEPEVLDLKLPR